MAIAISLLLLWMIYVRRRLRGEAEPASTQIELKKPYQSDVAEVRQKVISINKEPRREREKAETIERAEVAAAGAKTAQDAVPADHKEEVAAVPKAPEAVPKRGTDDDWTMAKAAANLNARPGTQNAVEEFKKGLAVHLEANPEEKGAVPDDGHGAQQALAGVSSPLRAAGVIPQVNPSLAEQEALFGNDPWHVNVDRSAFLFFQAVAYQMYLNNVQAYRLHLEDFRQLFASYVMLHGQITAQPPCEALAVLARAVRVTPNISGVWWTSAWPQFSLRAFSCRFNESRDFVDLSQAPSDVRGSDIEQDRRQVLWMTKGLPLATTGMLSEVVPFLSLRVMTSFTDSRVIRGPSLFSLATRLWLALFGALKNSLAKASTSEQGRVYEHFEVFFETYNRMFPCGNCYNQFVSIFKRFAKAIDQFWALQLKALYVPLMGKGPLPRYEPNCSAGWDRRLTQPHPNNTASVDPSLYLLPPLPASTQRTLTVALDIDETLLNARVDPTILRPWLKEFITGLHNLGCEVVIWTASTKGWGGHVATLFDPKEEIKHRIFRDPSWYKPHPATYTKDLRRLGRNMNDVLILENSPYSVWMNKRNAILIPDYHKSNPKDAALQHVLTAIKVILDTGAHVPEFISTSKLFNWKCPAHMWDDLDEAQPYYGIGDFTP